MARLSARPCAGVMAAKMLREACRVERHIAGCGLAVSVRRLLADFVISLLPE